MASQVWFVTGASRGLGFAIAQAVLEKGDAVVAAARNASRAEQVLGPSDRVFAVSIDVTDRASIPARCGHGGCAVRQDRCNRQ